MASGYFFGELNDGASGNIGSLAAVNGNGTVSIEWNGNRRLLL